MSAVQCERITASLWWLIVDHEELLAQYELEREMLASFHRIINGVEK